MDIVKQAEVNNVRREQLNPLIVSLEIQEQGLGSTTLRLSQSEFDSLGKPSVAAKLKITVETVP